MRVEFPATLLVIDYMKNGETVREAFAAASIDVDDAVNAVIDDMQAADVDTDRLVFGPARFVEFDASNWRHAGAHFMVVVEGDASVVSFAIEKWRKARDLSRDEAEAELGWLDGHQDPWRQLRVAIALECTFMEWVRPHNNALRRIFTETATARQLRKS